MSSHGFDNIFCLFYFLERETQSTEDNILAIIFLIHPLKNSLETQTIAELKMKFH